MRDGRVLIAAGASQDLSGVTAFLRQCGCRDICYAGSGNETRRCTSQDRFDLIIIDTPLPDETGDKLGVQLGSGTSAGIIVLCKSSAVNDISGRLYDSGAAVVSKPIHKTELYQAVRAGFSIRTRLQAAREENVRLQKKLRELRTVSQAKCLLIEKEGMTEQEAHRYIEKLAMDNRRSKEETAEEIISVHS